jgi:protease I
MSVGRKLESRRIAVLAADGFEKVELTVPVAALHATGAAVEIVSLRSGRIRGMNLHEPAARVAVDRTLAEASPDAYDALLIPGGYINPDLLRQTEAARQFVRRFDAAQKPIATLGHGPWLLASAGRRAAVTSWPGIRDVSPARRAARQAVIRDGNWVTETADARHRLVRKAIVELFAGDARGKPWKKRSLVSAPQRSAPPKLVVAALQWLPRPSLRTAAVMAVLLAVFALRSRRKRLAAA